MRGTVAKKLRRAAGNTGRYRALKRLYKEGKVIDGGQVELRAQPEAEVTESVLWERRGQAEARAAAIAARPSFARYAPITKNTAQRKLPVRPDSALAKARRSWMTKRAERWIKR